MTDTVASERDDLGITVLQAELYCVRRDRDYLRERVYLLEQSLDLMAIDHKVLGKRYDVLRRDLTQAESRYRRLKNKMPDKEHPPSKFGSFGPPTGKKPPDGSAVARKPRKRGTSKK